MTDLDLVAALPMVRQLIEQAGAAIMARLHDPGSQQKKADGSLVTDADLQANHIILTGLKKHFPHHAFLSEESVTTFQPSSPYTWVIDPLDGTKAYAKGIPGFSIMIGLLHGSQPILGVVFDPLEGHLYEAVRGHGATHIHQGRRTELQVSTRKALDTMPLIISTGFPEVIRKKLTTHLHGPILDPINSVGIKVGLLVRQKGDIYINHHSVHYWDTCAPQIILEESGGWLTRIDGAPLNYDLAHGTFSHESPTLATNNQCHGDIVAKVAPLFVPIDSHKNN